VIRASIRSSILRAGLLAGALASWGCATPGPIDAQRVTSPDTAGLMKTVRVLAADSMEGRRAGTAGGARARRYLIERLEQIGVARLPDRYEHSFPLPRDSAQGVNLLGAIPGSNLGGAYIVLSAHYDHVGIRRGEVYNGADDNASGVAAVLAIAEALKQRPLRHPVIIALFDAEEGGLAGARAFVANPPVARERIGLNVNLDMVGHSEAGILWVAGANAYPKLRPVIDSVAAAAPVVLKIGHDRAGVAGEQDWSRSSDHGPFHAAGTPFLYFGVEDHKDYHRATDDPETLTPVFFGKAVATVLEALRRVDAMAEWR
jgi:Zn-dependent M28 family amino/carboxypeptidase